MSLMLSKIQLFLDAAAKGESVEIPPSLIEEFKEAFTGAITDHLEGKKPIIELLTDGKLDASEMTLNNAELLRQAPQGLSQRGPGGCPSLRHGAGGA